MGTLNRMRVALQCVETLLSGGLVQRGYFTAPPPGTRAGWRFAGLGLWALAGAVLLIGMVAVSTIAWPLLASIALVALGAAIFVVAEYMPRKTRAGAEAAARWWAYRSFMESVNRLDALHGGQEGFERFLPHAVVFGIEQPWIDAFARVETTSAPAWYDTVSLDGGWMRSGWHTGTAIPLPDVDLPHLGGLQDVSSLASSAIQSSADVLADLFNEVSFSVTPQPSISSARPSLSNTNSAGSDVALRIGLAVLGAALSGGKGGSGGGGGGFW